jgi:branched-subunit amino acid transport protein
MLVLVLAVVLFSASTVLHFTHKESLSQFFVSLLALIPVSVMVQFAVKDIALSLQQRDYELLSEVFLGILGYYSSFASVAERS